LLTRKRIDKATETLTAGQVKFGDVFVINNLYSLVHSAKGEYLKALEYAQKSLLQAPSASTKAKALENIEKFKNNKDIN
jgi:hypothetical protein